MLKPIHYELRKALEIVIRLLETIDKDFYEIISTKNKILTLLFCQNCDMYLQVVSMLQNTF